MKTILCALAGVALLALGTATPAGGQDTARAKSLFQFDGASGYAPQSGVIADRQGTLFGTTTIGGTGPCLAQAGCGTVFALSPPAGGGSWVFNKLYDFQGGFDGGFPQAQLTLGPTGAVYGYTADGTFGSVFRLLPPTVPGQPWKFQTLYVFTNGADGNLDAVYAPLVFRRGALYGIASGGATGCGQFGCGSVFQLTPGAKSGPWTEKTLFRFTGGADSGEPNSIVGFPEGAALYVATSLGYGAVVAITPHASAGQWNERVLTRFDGDGGGHLPSNLVVASDGTLFGLANAPRAGIVFQLTPPSTGGSGWTRATIATVSDRRYGPVSLATGAGGTLIGAVQGDFDFFAGSVFRLTPPAAGGAWTYTELWNFDRGPDRNPINVVTGRKEHLFGVLGGGDSTNGSLFELP